MSKLEEGNKTLLSIVIKEVIQFERLKKWKQKDDTLICVKDMGTEDIREALKKVRNNYSGKSRTYWELPLLLELKLRTEQVRQITKQIPILEEVINNAEQTYDDIKEKLNTDKQVLHFEAKSTVS